MGRLCRSNDKAIAGVCAGIAEYFKWNVRQLRLIWVALAVVGLGSPVVFYILLWLLMPDVSVDKKSYEERMRKRLGR